MAVELYHLGLTSNSIKPRLVLREKGVAYVSRLVNLSAFEQHSEAYLKLNPMGVVPTLVHDGVPIVETNFIAEYVDEAFDGPPLRPKDPAGRAWMRFWAKLGDEVGYPAIAIYNWQRGFRPLAQGLPKDEMQRRLARVPMPGRRDLWRKMAEEGFQPTDFEESAARIRHVLDNMARQLATTTCLVGSDVTLADLGMVPFVAQFAEHRLEIFNEPQYAKVRRWYLRLIDRPAVQFAMNPSDETGPMKASKIITKGLARAA